MLRRRLFVAKMYILTRAQKAALVAAESCPPIQRRRMASNASENSNSGRDD